MSSITQEPKPNTNADMESSLPPRPSLPALTASADDIRSYLALLLTHERQLSQAYAETIAAKWNVGSGLELRRYSAGMFLRLFGEEDGWVLFWEARKGVRREVRWWKAWRLHMFTAFLVFWEVVWIALLATIEMGEGLSVFAIVTAVLAFPTLIGCSIWLLVASSYQSLTERELKNAVKASSGGK